jgi:hypothetical protein
MGGKGSKTLGSTPPLTHHRSGSSLSGISSGPTTSLPAQRAALVESKLQSLDQIYIGIAASAILNTTGDLMCGERARALLC